MYAVMEQLVGTVVRNANIFWHLLPFCGNRPGLSMERQGRDLLFRWDSGQAWLLQRRPIRFRRQSGWQITAANVTTLYRLNRELAQKNAVLEQRNEEMKEVLDGLVALQTKQTTESLRYKIHDLFAVRCRSQPARTAGCPGDDIPQLGRRCGRNGDLADRYPTGR